MVRMVRSPALFLMLVVALVGGCDDEEHPQTQKADPNTAAAAADSTDCVQPTCRNVPLPSSAHAIRLTHAQWENTVRDLLHLSAAPGLSASFPADPAPPGDRFGTAADSLLVTGALWHEYQRAAEALAELVVTTPSTLEALLPAAAKSGDDDARTTAFVEDFLPRAYRRPVTPAEVAAAVALGSRAAASEATSEPFLLRVRWILAGVLQSASFLYRIEGGEGAIADGRARLGPYELASKLSYALWGTMPNDELRGYAASGKLSRPNTLTSIVKTMVAAPSFDRTLLDFHDQLFRIPAFSGVVRQTTLFPKFYPEFGADAQEDARRTIRDLIVANPGTVSDLYGSKIAWVNAPLARVYGLDPVAVPGLAAAPTSFMRVEMPGPRAGILSHVGWLAMQGKSKDPATIQRGVFIARHTLCLPLGNPPPAAAGRDPSQIVAPTNRARVSGLTSGCGDGCHGGAGGVINPFGFAFEEFDALGQLRAMDGDLPIDSTGAVAPTPNGFSLPSDFADASSLMALLRESPWTHACYAAHWNAYLNGVSDLRPNATWLAPIVTKSMKGASVRDLVADLVQQDAFTTVSR